MAKPLTFKPAPVDPHLELERRLNAAPREHAEALLLLYDTLQAAHDKGFLDTLHGMLSARDAIAEKLSGFAKTPEGEAGMRNLLESARLYCSINPDLHERFNRAFAQTVKEYDEERKPPSLWQIFKRANSEDGRRSLSFFTFMLANLGRSFKR